MDPSVEAFVPKMFTHPNYNDTSARAELAKAPRTFPLTQGEFQSTNNSSTDGSVSATIASFDQLTTGTDDTSENYAFSDSDLDSPHYSLVHPDLVGQRVAPFYQTTQANSFNRITMDNKANVVEAYDDSFVHANALNPEYYLMPMGSRVVNIKTDIVQNIQYSVRAKVWSTLEKVSMRLMDLWNKREKGEKIYFLFAVNSSSAFCGLAEMSGPWDKDARIEAWAENAKSSAYCVGSIPVTWVFVKNVPYTKFAELTQGGTNRPDQPVSNMWNGMVFSHDIGRAVVEIYAQAPHTSNVLAWFKTKKQLQEEAAQPKEALNQRKSRGGYGGGNMNPRGNSSRRNVDSRDWRQRETMEPQALHAAQAQDAIVDYMSPSGQGCAANRDSITEGAAHHPGQLILGVMNEQGQLIPVSPAMSSPITPMTTQFHGEQNRDIGRGSPRGSSRGGRRGSGRSNVGTVQSRRGYPKGLGLGIDTNTYDTHPLHHAVSMAEMEAHSQHIDGMASPTTASIQSQAPNTHYLRHALSLHNLGRLEDAQQQAPHYAVHEPRPKAIVVNKSVGSHGGYAMLANPEDFQGIHSGPPPGMKVPTYKPSGLFGPPGAGGSFVGFSSDGAESTSSVDLHFDPRDKSTYHRLCLNMASVEDQLLEHVGLAHKPIYINSEVEATLPQLPRTKLVRYHELMSQREDILYQLKKYNQDHAKIAALKQHHYYHATAESIPENLECVLNETTRVKEPSANGGPFIPGHKAGQGSDASHQLRMSNMVDGLVASPELKGEKCNLSDFYAAKPDHVQSASRDNYEGGVMLEQPNAWWI